MIIVADEAIPAVAELFPQLGELEELRLLPAPRLTAETVKDAQVLLVRSLTRVDAALLAGSNVRAVGTATSGTDHIDTAYLAAEGIRLYTAKGSNAEAVADYCITALAFLKQKLKQQRGLDLSRVRVGIVGMGCTGSAFHRRLLRLGVATRVCDPPLQARAPQQHDYAALEEILACHIVSLHVPLTRDGPHATESLIDSRNLPLLAENAALINTSRGGVINEAHLKDALRENPGLQCIIDVWQNEPAIDPDLVALATLATPHMAGYSQQAKQQATMQLFKALQEDAATIASSATPPATPLAETTPSSSSFDVHPTSALAPQAPPASPPAGSAPADPWHWPLHHLNLLALSQQLKSAADSDHLTGHSFEHLRQTQLSRPQFDHIPIPATVPLHQAQTLAALGFRANCCRIG